MVSGSLALLLFIGLDLPLASEIPKKYPCIAHSRIYFVCIVEVPKTTGRQRSEQRIISDTCNAGCTRVSTEQDRKVGR